MKFSIGLAIALAAATAALALPAGARASGSDEQLLRTYQPMFVFDPDGIQIEINIRASASG